MAPRYFSAFTTNATFGAPTSSATAESSRERPAAGFRVASLWDSQEKMVCRSKELVVKGLIDRSATVVLISAKTYARKFVEYEIEESIARGNGLLGIYIRGIEDPNGHTDVKGLGRSRLTITGASSYNWNHENSVNGSKPLTRRLTMNQSKSGSRKSEP